MSLKKITSLSMLLSMLVMTFTGVLLFIAPPGRVANWTNWEIVGLSKSLIGEIHTTFMVLFIVATILHIFYNLKPMISYMKNKAREFVFFTKEMIVSVAVTIAFLFGTIYQVVPFSTFLDFGEEIKNSWEKEISTAPYSHAELSSLEEFVTKMNYDLKEIKEILYSKSISYKVEQSLSQIAANNKLSPNELFEIMKTQKSSSQSYIPLSGMGKKSIEDVALTLGISSNKLIEKLKDLGIEASKDETFKSVAEKNDLSPMDILKDLGY